MTSTSSSLVNVCFNGCHGGLRRDSSLQVNNLDLLKPAAKILRAISRTLGCPPTDFSALQLVKCHCHDDPGQEEVVINTELNVKDLDIQDNVWVFVRAAPPRPSSTIATTPAQQDEPPAQP